MNKFNLLVEKAIDQFSENTIPSVLYHYSPKDRMDRILDSGLKINFPDLVTTNRISVVKKIYGINPIFLGTLSFCERLIDRPFIGASELILFKIKIAKYHKLLVPDIPNMIDGKPNKLYKGKVAFDPIYLHYFPSLDRVGKDNGDFKLIPISELINEKRLLHDCFRMTNSIACMCDISPSEIEVNTTPSFGFVYNKLKNKNNLVFRGCDENEINDILKTKRLNYSTELIGTDSNILKMFSVSNRDIPRWAKKNGINMTKDIVNAEGYGNYLCSVNLNDCSDYFELGDYVQLRYPEEAIVTSILDIENKKVIYLSDNWSA